MPSVNVDGDLFVNYISAGDDRPGPPLLLLHGGGADSASLSWSDTVSHLSRRRRVLAPDWPGYGLSGDSSKPPTVPFYADVARVFLDALGISKAHIAGLSLGGGAAAQLAISSPSLVEKLVLVAPYGFAATVPWHFLSYLFLRTPGLNAATWAWARRSRENSRRLLTSIFHDPRKMPEELVDLVYAAARDPRAAKSWQEFQLREIRWNRLGTVFGERLKGIQAETLIVLGSKDPLVPRKAVEDAAKQIPSAEVAMMENCGHWPQREDPERFYEIVNGFLDRGASKLEQAQRE
ncbi:alpha/beta hydrolase fold protein [Hyaloraphidium curvatum]|nr:alpha/beta hydrolase fold protein [Hyaloraphidium curvatum]